MYGSQKIAVYIDNDNNIWFNAKDTAKSLGYVNTKRTIRKNVDRCDVRQLKHIDIQIKKHPHTLFLSESGLYSLMLNSRMKRAKEFTLWVTKEVLPSIRKYGSYKLKKKYEKERLDMMNKINILESQHKLLMDSMKKEKFPTNSLVYVINYNTDNEEVYRIGQTTNMNTRKKIYNTHTLHNRKVVFYKEFDYPLRLEGCIRYMLYNYRYLKKDYYMCNLGRIKTAINKCISGFVNIDKQRGGSKTNKKSMTPFEKYLVSRIKILKREKNKLDKTIEKYEKLLGEQN